VKLSKVKFLQGSAPNSNKLKRELIMSQDEFGNEIPTPEADVLPVEPVSEVIPVLTDIVEAVPVEAVVAVKPTELEKLEALIDKLELESVKEVKAAIAFIKALV
jgi:hypothetical protein